MSSEIFDCHLPSYLHVGAVLVVWCHVLGGTFIIQSCWLLIVTDILMVLIDSQITIPSPFELSLEGFIYIF